MRLEAGGRGRGLLLCGETCARYEYEGCFRENGRSGFAHAWDFDLP